MDGVGDMRCLAFERRGAGEGGGIGDLDEHGGAPARDVVDPPKATEPWVKASIVKANPKPLWP